MMFMRPLRSLLAVSLLTAVLSFTARAGADDDFIAIYNLIQQADNYREAGQVATAREAYGNAQKRLRDLQRAYPSWNERVVNYRLRYVSEKLSALPDAGPQPAQTPAGTITNSPAGTAPAPDTSALAPAGEVIEQFNALNAEIGKLNNEKKLLEAKLREALTAQPAPVDPKEFQQAIDRITSLQSTNKVLIANLEKQQEERKNLVERVVADEARAALNEANRQLMAQKTAAASLQKERAELEKELKKVRDGDLKQLKNENATLKTQVVELKSETERGKQVADLTARLGKLQSKLDETSHANELLLADKARLEKQIDDFRARQSEESIVRINKLQTDLAVAKADAGRNAARAEEIAGLLTREKTVRLRLEQDNQSLTNRVVQLTSQLEAAKALEATLVSERAERAEVEAQLKAAERRLAAATEAKATAPAAAPAGGGTKIDPTTAAQLKVVEGEVARLRDSLRDSRAREAEIRTLLSEADSQRKQAQMERAELAKRLAQAEQMALESPRGQDARAIRSLEQRVKALERQRDELSKRIQATAQRVTTQQAAARRQRSIGPRERALEFRENR